MDQKTLPEPKKKSQRKRLSANKSKKNLPKETYCEKTDRNFFQIYFIHIKSILYTACSHRNIRRGVVNRYCLRVPVHNGSGSAGAVGNSNRANLLYLRCRRQYHHGIDGKSKHQPYTHNLRPNAPLFGASLYRHRGRTLLQPYRHRHPTYFKLHIQYR